MSDIGESHDVLRGEFTVINNRVHVTSPRPTATHPIEKAHQALILELSFLAVPRIHVSPEPEEFEDVADYLIRLAQAFDRHIKAVGKEVKANASTRIDLGQFEDPCFNAVQGWSTHQCDRAAAAAREERAEFVSDTDYRQFGVGA